jgi:hypothetical protein
MKIINRIEDLVLTNVFKKSMFNLMNVKKKHKELYIISLQFDYHNEKNMKATLTYILDDDRNVVYHYSIDSFIWFCYVNKMNKLEKRKFIQEVVIGCLLPF